MSWCILMSPDMTWHGKEASKNRTEIYRRGNCCPPPTPPTQQLPRDVDDDGGGYR